MTAGIGLGTLQCGPGRDRRCEVVVLQEEDTAQVYSGKDRNQVVMARKDTVPKPYSNCLTLYADTVPKPR